MFVLGKFPESGCLMNTLCWRGKQVLELAVQQANELVKSKQPPNNRLPGQGSVCQTIVLCQVSK